MYYVYVLRSLKYNQFYTGYTNNLKRRIGEHEKGTVHSTKYKRPLKLVYFEACLNKEDAVKREKYLKTSYGKRYIKNRILNYLSVNITRVK